MRKAASLRLGDPQQVGAYRLTGLLGEGGQGSVYRGEAPDGGPVAVKPLHARFGGDAKARARFAAELSHAERVAPFCTARVLDADLEGDRPYIMSEFVDGPSPAEMVATDGPPGGSALDRIAIATVTALAAIHEAGIVHRDFKPNNVIMGTPTAAPFPPCVGPRPPAQGATPPRRPTGPGAAPPSPYGLPAGPGMPGPGAAPGPLRSRG